MSYHFKIGDEAVQDGVRRIAKSQIEAAIEEIDDESVDRVETVHQVRKRCKKLRGLIRLVRPAFPGYAEENAAFRDAAASLSGVRDAHVMVETFDALATRFGRAFDHGRFDPIRARLVDKKNAASKDSELLDARLALFRETMVEALDRAKGWKLDGDGAAAWHGGYEKTFKRGVKALRKARKDPTTKKMHELRKRAKYHWYHARLLQDVWPAAMEGVTDELDRLGDILGDEHDLAVFQETIDQLAGGDVDRAAAGDLRTLAASRRKELQAAGLALAERAFAGDPEAAADRMAALWKAWRRRHPDLADPGADAGAEAASTSGSARETGAETDGEDTEIERKFVVTSDDWRPAVKESHHIRQGYLANTDRISLRVRITDDNKAEMTVKSPDPALSREEIEFRVPLGKARQLMALAEGTVIDKARHLVPVGGVTVEVDEFNAPQGGLVIAEIEMTRPDQTIPKIKWLGPEVTGDAAFYGATLASQRQ